MKKTLACVTLAAAAAAGSGAALAQPGVGYSGASGYGYGYGPYFGVSAGDLMYNERGLGQMNPTIALFHVGQQFNPYVGLEGRIGTNVSGGSWDGYHIDSQVIYAGYIRGTLPINPWVSAYGLLGLGGTQWHRNYADDSSNDVAVSFGVGAEFNVGGNTSLDLEWTRLTNGNNVGYGYTADTLTFGVIWRL